MKSIINTCVLSASIVSSTLTPLVALGNGQTKEEETRPWAVSEVVAGVRGNYGSTSFHGLTGAQTNGHFMGFIEEVTADYEVYPLVNDVTATTIIMIEGEMLIRVAGPDLKLTDLTLKTGQWMHFPPGNAHSFKANGAPAKFVLLHSPGHPQQTEWFTDLPEHALKDAESSAKFLVEQYGEDFDLRLVPELGYPGDPQ